MKKIISVLSIMIMCISFANVSLAAGDNLSSLLLGNLGEQNANAIAMAPETIRVQQNGEYIDFKDSNGNVVEPQIINSRTMVPFRKIFNALGVTDSNISWDGETKKVVAKKENIIIELQIDNTIAKKTISGDTTEIKLDAAPVIIEGRTLVPVRFIAESMNKQVGWDEWNRTVIIIDTNELVQELENAIPKYMQMMNSETKNPENYTSKIKLSGKMDYQQKSEKSFNSTINLTGTVNINKNKSGIALDLDAKLTGKGEIYDSLKENNFTTFQLGLIALDDTIYMKSSLLDGQTAGRWAMIQDDSIRDTMKTLTDKDSSLNSALQVKEEDLNIYTYESLQVTVKILEELLKDDNIKVIEKGTSKTYEYTITLNDLLKVISSLGGEVNLNGVEGSVKLISSYKNNVPKTDSSEINFSYAEGDEAIKISIKAEGKVSEGGANIVAPSVVQVVDANSIS